MTGNIKNVLGGIGTIMQSPAAAAAGSKRLNLSILRWKVVSMGISKGE
jgi:hypothetical protein